MVEQGSLERRSRTGIETREVLSKGVGVRRSGCVHGGQLDALRLEV